VILISYGINDYEVNNFSLTLQTIIDFIQRNNQTNIILMNLPYRYDLLNAHFVETVDEIIKQNVIPYTAE
jgi:hypothetical protein